MQNPLDDDMEATPPQTESAKERGFPRDVDERKYGQAEELDQDHAGDIADEGPGHRG
jgi:hypothetical protein